MLPGGQLQTLAGQLLGPSIQLQQATDELVSLPGGDQLLLHLNAPRPAATPRAPVVLLMHGLGGCSESTYVKRITDRLTGRGYTVARFNHRGCGRGAERLARGIYHAGRTEDLAAALAHLGTRYPGRPLLVAAFSLSANLLLKHLGDAGIQGRESLIERALAVCPPVDLERCSQALSARHNRHIDLFYTRRLMAVANTRSQLFPELGPAAFPRRMNLRLFDELYTAPQAGYSSRAEYYDRASARHVVHAIRTPTLVLAAADDPIIPEHSFAGVRFSDAVTIQMERSGGHMGFIAAKPTRFGDRRWMDGAVVDWVEQAQP